MFVFGGSVDVNFLCIIEKIEQDRNFQCFSLDQHISLLFNFACELLEWKLHVLGIMMQGTLARKC